MRHRFCSWRERVVFAAGCVFLLTATAALLAQDAARETPSALKSDPKGWTDLLAGAGPALKGWTRGPIPPEAPLGPRSQWSLDQAGGHLICEGDGGHEWLRWDKPMADGVFHVEWRFMPKAGEKGFNSGIYARNSADARIWHQAQTGDRSGGYIFGETEVDGQLQRINLRKQQPKSRVKAAGEWNTFEITCRGKEMTLWTNGAVTNHWRDCQVRSGYVGLEAEGHRIEFRNVKLKRFPTDAAAEKAK